MTERDFLCIFFSKKSTKVIKMHHGDTIVYQKYTEKNRMTQPKEA